MATRSSGRNDDRSSQRGRTGSSGSGRGASGTGGTTSTRSTSGATNTRGATGTTNPRAASGATSGRTASSAGAATGTTRPGSASANRQEAGSAGGASAQSASSPNQSASSFNQSASSSNQTTTNPKQSETSGGGSASTPSSDRERELRTSREQTGTSRPSSTAQRSGMGTESHGFSPRGFGGGANTPFAMMRRMMDDMDRLFSDFGFMHPAQLASSFFDDNAWRPQRSLGAGSSSGTGITSPQSGGQSGQLSRGGQSPWHSLRSLWAPQVEVFERGNNLVVRADLPGLSREDIDVELDNDALIIRGERRNELEDEDDSYYRSERSYGTFYRAIPLPENVDVSSCNATFKDGVLEVTLPKPPSGQSRAKRIDVR